VSLLNAFSDRRVDERLESLSLEITLDGVRYPAIDWSLSGILLADHFGERTPGDKVEGSFQICEDMKAHPFKAVVVRHNSIQGQLAINFTDLSIRTDSVLEALMTGRNSECA
jgi:hypothetical protein